MIRRVGDGEVESRILEGLGQDAVQQGDDGLAIEYLQQSLSLARQHGSREPIAWVFRSLAEASWGLQDCESTRNYYDQCIAISQK